MKDLHSFTTQYGMADELFKAVMSLDKSRVEKLKENGVTLTEDVKRTLVNGGGSMMSNKPAAPFWYLYMSDLMEVSREDFVYISRVFREETGAALYYSETLANTINDYFFNSEVFICLMECYDLKKMNKTKTLQALIRKNRIELLVTCAEHGWLKSPSKRDEMIEYAQAQNRPECTAWLLDFKNRTADLSAERAKAEKKAEREFNAAPNSALELKKLWSWTKGEDGGLIITSYKGEEQEVTVPVKIGNSAVTAIGEYALSPIAPRLKEPYITRRIVITKIIVPNGIKTIGKCAFGGSGMNTQWHSIIARLKEVTLPASLDIFEDRQAAENAPKIIEEEFVVAVIPNSENARFYCVKNNIRYRFADSTEVHIPSKEITAADALFSAIIAADREKVKELKRNGAALTDSIKDCLLHEKRYSDALYNIQEELYDMIGKASTEDREFILKALKEETGEPLFLNRYRHDLLWKSTPELFDCILEYFDVKFLDKNKKMQEFINEGKTEHLAVCAKHGWLKIANKRDEMIKYASDHGKTECTAWLLDFKNRTADLKAEQRRAEKRLERELNADPNSPKELKKLWRFSKLSDGTLEITCYKGAQTAVTVPEKIGEDTVTSIGNGAFTGYYGNSLRKSADKTFCEFHKTGITAVTLPETIRSIGAFAFSLCNALCAVNIPDSVKSIEYTAFVFSENLTVTVGRGSYAENFCKLANVKFKYNDEV